MPQFDPHPLADELMASYINGNRSHVIGRLAQLPILQAISVVSIMTAQFEARERQNFVRSLAAAASG